MPQCLAFLTTLHIRLTAQVRAARGEQPASVTVKKKIHKEGRRQLNTDATIPSESQSDAELYIQASSVKCGFAKQRQKLFFFLHRSLDTGLKATPSTRATFFFVINTLRFKLG